MSETPRAWRGLVPDGGAASSASATTEVFLVDSGPSAQQPAGMAGEFDEEPWREPHDFVLIDTHGDTRQKFTATCWSIEDELGVSVYAVVEGALRHRSVSIVYSDTTRVRRREEVVLEGMQAVVAGEGQAWKLFSAALARHRQQGDDEAAGKAQAADARIAAIPGALDDHDAGDGFRRAQEALCSRVSAYGIAIDAAMLRVLIRFGRMHRSIRESVGAGNPAAAVFDAVLERLVIGCRMAAFDRSLERNRDDTPAKKISGAFPALPATMQDEMRELEAALGGLEQELLREAEGQERVDARNNAIKFRAAADYVSRARAYLKSGSSR